MLNTLLYTRNGGITTNDNSTTRFVLRQAWNTNYSRYPRTSITPFRAVTNSGDLLSRRNYSCGGSCQTAQSKPGLYGIRSRMGNVLNNCDSSGVPPASCNVRYVYDSSNYVTYKRQRELNVNYNDRTFGLLRSKFLIR